MKAFLVKGFSLLLLITVLGIATSLVHGVLQDRLRYRDQALSSVSRSLAGPQALAAGAMVIPYEERWTEQESFTDTASGKLQQRSKPMSREAEMIVLPETLDVSGQLDPDPRRRGLFRINGYVFSGKLRGALRLPEEATYPRAHSGSTVHPGVPRLVLALSNARGLQEASLKVDGQTLNLAPGTGLVGEPVGVSARLASAPAAGTQIRFEFDTRIGGARRLDILPLGGQTQAHLVSNWPHPSFGGSFLPTRREIRSGGFDADWQTSALASNTRDRWLASARAAKESRPANTGFSNEDDSALGWSDIDSFAVSLDDPIDIYSLSDRALKYSLLFIVLTLGIFALNEVLGGLRLHPVQYLLVGLAMVVFFLLLLALSEHIGFSLAYLAGSLGCIGLIGFYVSSVLRSWQRGAGFTAVLALLYAALYGILRSEQNALMLGSLLLFLVLAAVMTLTRRIDWHALTGTSATRAAEAV